MAPFTRPEQPYPLIVLSPGFAMGAEAYGWLAEHLASYGFVVTAPEHQEHMDPADQLWQAAVARPQSPIPPRGIEQTIPPTLLWCLVNNTGWPVS